MKGCNKIFYLFLLHPYFYINGLMADRDFFRTDLFTSTIHYVYKINAIREIGCTNGNRFVCH